MVSSNIIISLKRFKMFLPGVIGFIFFLGISTSVPIDAPKIKPVDLSYSCMKITLGEETEEKAPVILIHGVLGSKEVWRGFQEHLCLKTGRKVCAPDLRNHGDSPWDDRSDVAAMSEDIVELMDNLRMSKAVLLGLSLGGKVAVHVSLENPDRVEKVIVGDMRPNGVSKGALTDIKHTVALLNESLKIIPENADEKSAKKAVLTFINSQLRKANLTELRKESDADLLPLTCSDGKCRWKFNMKVLARVANNPLAQLTNSTGVYNGPALFAYGTESPFKVGEVEPEIKQLFPNAKLFPIKGAGHNVGSYNEFKEEVLTFINSDEASE
ncbi:protein ABHD11-like isoform X2 [Stegodyphus dumicola]|uniref:protein ABHD11-like isoform X2 n=1 Tax=Stegodyphus dumicola TaxID=202533 RepID=UPI0015B31944|nr:protein ABHD11-like isoform X2 [Stegodyphus dumicola]